MARPVARGRALLRHQPLAARRRPPGGPLVAAVVDELQELRVADRRDLHLEGRHIGRLRRQFVGPRKAVGLAPAKREAPARELQRAALPGRTGTASGGRRFRGRHAQRLQQRGQRLALRIFMEQRAAVRVQGQVAVVWQQCHPAQQAVEHVGGIALDHGHVGQRDFPALVRADAVRIEPFVGAVKQRRLGRHRHRHAAAVYLAHAAQAPPLRMPGDMAQRPQRRVGVVLARHIPGAAGLAERCQPCQRAVARLDQRLRQAVARQPARVGPGRLAAGEIEVGKHGKAAHR
ncbi:hypothetical protein D9M72_479650 [compost metagenome]